MVNSQLVDYIKRELSQGYNAQAIISTLLRSGYSQAEIDEAFNFISQPGRPAQPKKKLNFLVVGIVLVVIAVIGVLLLIFLLKGEEEALVRELSLETTLSKNQFLPDETISFGIRVSNEGERQEYEIKVESVMIDQFGEERQKVEKRLEMTEIELVVVATGQIQIPDDAPAGNYVLESTAFYDRKSTKSRLNFEVVEEIEAEVPGTAAPTTAAPGGITESDLTRIDSIKEVAAVDEVQALDFCKTKLDNLVARDKCLRDIGIDLNKPEFCAEVSNVDERDTCFLNVALGLMDYSLCVQITKADLRRTCEMFG